MILEEQEQNEVNQISEGYSSQYLEIAKAIPPKYRKSILKENHIYKAITEFSDNDMMKLWFYWSNFIDDNYKYQIKEGKIIVPNSGCKVCLSVLLDKWILIQPYLELLERNSKLLAKI